MMCLGLKPPFKRESIDAQPSLIVSVCLSETVRFAVFIRSRIEFGILRCAEMSEKE